MFQGLSEKIVASGIENNYIKQEDKEEHIYGMNMFFNVFVNIASMIIIGIITNKLIECIVFCLIYKFLRKYTGGFHFESALYCYISSCCMYFIAIGINMYSSINSHIECLIVILSSIIIFIISPIEAINKPLDECEQIVFRRRARINTVIILGIYCGMLFVSKNIAQMMGIGVFAVMCFAVAGKILIVRYKRKN